MTKQKRGPATQIYCCECSREVQARLTSGSEIYPHRSDLQAVPIWRCDGCGNYVGCHHKTKDRTRPVGNIPTPELRKARSHIHAILDPVWRSGQRSRAECYRILSDKLGYAYHTAEIRTIEEARTVWRIIKAHVAISKET